MTLSKQYFFKNDKYQLYICTYLCSLLSNTLFIIKQSEPRKFQNLTFTPGFWILAEIGRIRWSRKTDPIIQKNQSRIRPNKSSPLILIYILNDQQSTKRMDVYFGQLILKIGPDQNIRIRDPAFCSGGNCFGFGPIFLS